MRCDGAMNLDDLDVWIQTCEWWIILFECVVPMAMECLATTQHWNMSHHVTIHVSGHWFWIHRFEPRDYVIYNRQHWLFWMWLQDVLFLVCKRFYFLECYYWRAKMVRHGRTIYMHNYALSVLQCGWPNRPSWMVVPMAYDVYYVGNLQELSLCWIVINVHNVGIWDVLRHL